MSKILLGTLKRYNIDPGIIGIDNTQKLFHLRVPHGKELGKKTTGWKSQDELLEDFPEELVLRPIIPRSDPTREDTSTPRVSFSRTVPGAAGSLGLKGTCSYAYIGVYIPVSPVEVLEPLSKPLDRDNFLYVHDAEKWEEVWALRPTRVKLIKIIFPDEKIEL